MNRHINAMSLNPTSLKRAPWRGLHLQVLLWVILPTAALLLAVAVGGAILHERAMRELVGERDSRATQAAADNLAERLHQREVALALLASFLEEEAFEAPLPPELQALFDYGFILTDGQGAVLDTWSPLEATGDAPSTLWDWHSAEAASPVMVSRNNGEMLVVFSARVPERPGMLYGATSLEGLGIPALLDQLVAGDLAQAYLADADGHLLHSTDGQPLDGDTVHQNVLGVVSAGEGGYQDDGTDDHVISYSTVAGMGWVLVIEEAWHTVSTPQLRVSHWALLAVVAITLLGLVITAFSALGVVRPLQRLEAQATRLMRGDFQAILNPVGGIQEIQDLQGALMQMAQAIQQAQGKLHEYIGVITTAQEDERHRLARDLHDDVVQTLIALNQQAQKAQRSLNRDPQHSLEQLQGVRALSEQVVQDIRRFIHDLRPSYLTELGLAPALEMLAEHEQGVKVSYQVTGEVCRLDTSIELAVYRITQEALSNIRKHSRAVEASIQLYFTPTGLRLNIHDNGCGFHVPPLHDLARQGHFGLLGIQERAQLIQAHLDIRSSAHEGTTLQLSVPF